MTICYVHSIQKGITDCPIKISFIIISFIIKVHVYSLKIRVSFIVMFKIPGHFRPLPITTVRLFFINVRQSLFLFQNKLLLYPVIKITLKPYS